MVEAQLERVLDGQRAAEPDAAEQRELPPPLQQQPDHLQEILVPAHGDAVLGDAAETRHHAVVERLGQLLDVADRPEGHPLAVTVTPDSSAERLDLQAVDPTTVWPSFIR